MKIHAIQTGTVAIKARQVEGVGSDATRALRTLFGHEWTDPLPIYAFAIEHPEGVIVVDTGETARATEPGYFPAWHPYYRYGVREWITPQEEIGPQLQALGIEPADVRRVVVTHMHTDHAGGLHHFPHSEILVSRGEMKTASGRGARLRGYPSNRFPSWLNPTLIDLPAEPFGPFPESLPLTEAGDVTIVPLPGHTPSQIGVVVRDGTHNVLMAGDASYTQELMLSTVVDGVSPNGAVARLTHQRIRTLAAQTPTVYLVGHDPQTGNRLTHRQVIDVATLRAATP